MKYLLLLLGIMILFCTGDSNPLAMQKKLQGNWYEYFKYVSAQYEDTTFASFLNFKDDKFSVTTYRDTFRMILDTTYEGTFYAEKDTLRMYLGGWSEIYYMEFMDDGNMLLSASYSIDIGGNKIGDFQSILWYTRLRKNGIFIPN